MGSWILSLGHNVYSNFWTLQVFFMSRQICMNFFKKKYLWFEQDSSWFTTNDPFLPHPLQNPVLKKWRARGTENRADFHLHCIRPPCFEKDARKCAVSAWRRTIFHCNAPLAHARANHRYLKLTTMAKSVCRKGWYILIVEALRGAENNRRLSTFYSIILFSFNSDMWYFAYVGM